MSGMKDMFGDDPFAFERQQQQREANVSAAKAARDEGIAKLTAKYSSWFATGMYQIRTLSVGWIGTGEDIKHILIEKGYPPPDPHCVGALIQQARRAHLLFPTGNWITPQDKASHGRPIREYRR